MKILMIQLNKFEFTNKDSAENLIRYITRTRENEDRLHELLWYGSYHGFFYQKPVEEMIAEFEYVQKIYGTKGSLMCHYVSHISPEVFADMNNDLNILNTYATACCKYIWNMGHQICYAIHYSAEYKLHIHFAINTTNYKNGHKLRQYYREIHNTIEKPLDDLLSDYTIYRRTVTSFDDLS